MISVYHLINDHLERGGIEALSQAPLWIDLLEPTQDEEQAVEAALGVGVPTREEMQEIEASSRLYREGEALFMTAPVLTNSDSLHPQNSAISFILTSRCTVTVRYATPQPFVTFAHRALKQKGACGTADAILVGLLEAIIDRLADVLERIGAELDGLSHEVFQPHLPVAGGRSLHADTDFQAILRRIGRNGDLTSKARDSLHGIERIVVFLGQPDDSLTRKNGRNRIKTMSRDIRSLSEHAGFLSGKITFLLDATLGMINIQQNNIIKLFSVMAVIFLPPTLIASIYGMNFDFMPELHSPAGYPLALLLMVVSAILPYAVFKRRGWL